MTRSSSPVGIALLAGLSACASMPRETSGDRQLVVHVENNIAPPSAVRIRLVAQDGAERELGDTPAASAKVWRFRHAGEPRRYRLIALRSDSAMVISRPFLLGPFEAVHWNLARNAVATTRWERGYDPLLELLAPPPREVARLQVARATPDADQAPPRSPRGAPAGR